MHLPPSVPAFARIANSLTLADHRRDEAGYLDARRQIPGWSLPIHYTLFGHVLAALGAAKPSEALAKEGPLRILVCGVYHGLDLALIQHAARALGRKIELVGVDLFSDQPCADWPAEKRHLTWEQAFDCAPPSIVAARLNAPGAEIVQMDSVSYLMRHPGEFDFIWFDTSHDEKTVLNECVWGVDALREGGLVGGDDYYQPGTYWGVDRAVAQVFPHHIALFNRLWLASDARPRKAA
jgi:hypothetical protein